MKSITEDTGSKHAWYALRVRVRSEHNVATLLGDKGVECFTPYWEERRASSRRRAAERVSVFPGYTFGHFALADIFHVLNTPGVQQVLGPGRPEPIEGEVIDSLRTLFSGTKRVHPSTYLREGETVEILRGPLRGSRGILVRSKADFRLVISVHVLQRSVYAEVDADMVAPLGTTSSAA